jgi:hypothetical protein
MVKFIVTYLPFPESDATSEREEYGYGNTEAEQALDVVNQFRKNYPLWRIKEMHKAV